MSARYLLRKTATLALTLYLTVTANFLLFHVLPGSPVQLLARSGHYTAAARAQLVRLFGLNHSLATQYVIYLNHMVHGNLGFSYVYRLPVTTVMGSAIGNTVLLVGTATLLTIVIGVWFGVVSAKRANSMSDASITVISLGLWSMPDFFTGMILIFIAGVWTHVLPVSGIETPGLAAGTWDRVLDVARHLVLPALTLVLVNAAEFSLITRNSLVDAADGGLRPHGPGEGALASSHRVASRAAQCSPARHDGDGALRRDDPWRGHPGGDGLFMAGHGSAHLRLRRAARLPRS